MTTAPTGSVVIPAHNEAAVIASTLRSLFDGLDPAVEVVVVSNGSVDGTADVVRSTRHPVVLVECPSLGKVGALRLAEQHTSALPRIYLDADVELTGRAANDVLAALRSGSAAARPPVRFDVDDASWVVRRFYAVKQSLPSITGDLCGAGVYALSEDARARFDEFPDVTADDLFAARVVDRSEVRIVDTDPVVVHPPRTTRALLHTLARVYRGNQQMREVRPELVSADTESTSRELARLLRRPGSWLSVAVYTTMVVIGRLLARRSASDAWERDETSRAGRREAA